MVWTCHEERPGVYTKKDDGNGVTGKEEKMKTKEKIFRCCERRYGGSWCEGDGCCRQKDVNNDDTLWPPLTKGKGRKERPKGEEEEDKNLETKVDCTVLENLSLRLQNIEQQQITQQTKDIIQESYDKRLNLLIHGIEESDASETLEKTKKFNP